MPHTEHRRPRRLAGPARTMVFVALAGLAAVLLGGAASGEAVGPGAVQPAYLRTAHLLSGAGPVDVRLTPFSA